MLTEIRPTGAGVLEIPSLRSTVEWSVYCIKYHDLRLTISPVPPAYHRPFARLSPRRPHPVIAADYRPSSVPSICRCERRGEAENDDERILIQHQVITDWMIPQRRLLTVYDSALFNVGSPLSIFLRIQEVGVIIRWNTSPILN